jgi:hypothetical protein
MSTEFKKNQEVKAKTVTGKSYAAGKISEIRQGQKGAWYSVKLGDGSIINTRAACIKPA